MVRLHLPNHITRRTLLHWQEDVCGDYAEETTQRQATSQKTDQGIGLEKVLGQFKICHRRPITIDRGLDTRDTDALQIEVGDELLRVAGADVEQCAS